jgi:hypothetical protein
VNERNDQKDGPYRVADVKTVWTRIARMVDHLHKLGVIDMSAPDLALLINRLEVHDQPDVDVPALNTTLEVLAAPDAMCASDWLRMKVVDARGRTNVSLHPLDLRGLKCRRLVVRFDGTDEEPVCRVTIHNRRGDIASVESTSFANALDGAINMAGARRVA